MVKTELTVSYLDRRAQTQLTYGGHGKGISSLSTREVSSQCLITTLVRLCCHGMTPNQHHGLEPPIGIGSDDFVG